MYRYAVGSKTLRTADLPIHPIRPIHVPNQAPASVYLPIHPIHPIHVPNQAPASVWCRVQDAADGRSRAPALSEETLNSTVSWVACPHLATFTAPELQRAPLHSERVSRAFTRDGILRAECRRRLRRARTACAWGCALLQKSRAQPATRRIPMLHAARSGRVREVVAATQRRC